MAVLEQIEAGAEAVIVQPPLLPDCFAQWWSKAQERGYDFHIQ